MGYKVYTIFLASEDDIKDEHQHVKVSLKNSEVFAPVLTFDGDKEDIKEQISEAVNNFLEKCHE